MRPYIPIDVRMRETAELQKSVAADLNVPDPSPIITKKAKKESASNENSAEYDRGTSGGNDNASVESPSE
jgi:hypothetical protein